MRVEIFGKVKYCKDEDEATAFMSERLGCVPWADISMELRGFPNAVKVDYLNLMARRSANHFVGEFLIDIGGGSAVIDFFGKDRYKNLIVRNKKVNDCLVEDIDLLISKVAKGKGEIDITLSSLVGVMGLGDYNYGLCPATIKAICNKYASDGIIVGMNDFDFNFLVGASAGEKKYVIKSIVIDDVLTLEMGKKIIDFLSIGDRADVATKYSGVSEKAVFAYWDLVEFDRDFNFNVFNQPTKEDCLAEYIDKNINEAKGILSDGGVLAVRVKNIRGKLDYIKTQNIFEEIAECNDMKISEVVPITIDRASEKGRLSSAVKNNASSLIVLTNNV